MTATLPLDLVISVGATRTSHRWAEPPGNWDRLNCRALFDSDGGERIEREMHRVTLARRT